MASVIALIAGIIILLAGLGAMTTPLNTVTLASNTPIVAARTGAKLGTGVMSDGVIEDAAADMGAGAVVIGEDMEIVGTVIEIAPK